MRRIILWATLGGVVLITAVIIFELFGTFLYMRSPQQAVSGALAKLLSAKSFSLSLEGVDDAKDGLSFNIAGALDKRVLTKPVADLKFSFQSEGQVFYGAGDAKAKDGEIYLRFDQVAGIPKVLPGALQAIWAGMSVDALLAVGRDKFFPDTPGSFTEDDMQALVVIAKKHLPFSATKIGKQLFMDNVVVVPYDVVLDRGALYALMLEVKSAVKGSALDVDEKRILEKTTANLPPIAGTFWIAKNDGTLRSALLIAKGASSSFHLNLRFADFDRGVSVDPPTDARPLVELLRRLFGTSLSGVTPKLPFDLPVPIWNINETIPQISNSTQVAGDGKQLGGLPNLIKLFYGTDQLFGGGK